MWRASQSTEIVGFEASEQLAQELRTTGGMWLSAGSDKGYFHGGLEDRQPGSFRDYASATPVPRFNIRVLASHGAWAR
jgi:hypothetical protein